MRRLNQIVAAWGSVGCLGMCYALASPGASAARVHRRVVSLNPSVTEMIVGVGALDRLVGVTHHESLPSSDRTIQIVGGFAAPNLKTIERLKPDLVFAASLHRDIDRVCRPPSCELVVPELSRLEDTYRTLDLVGRMLGKRNEASALIKEIRSQLARVGRRVDTIADADRPRVIRIMGRSQVMTPGDDSFQLDMIRAAGGIAPRTGKKGHVVPITLQQWRAFDPSVIYGCGGDRALLKTLTTRPGWRDVEAVRSHRIYFFPCELTCRPSIHAGYFVTWLASALHAERFAEVGASRAADVIVGRREIRLSLPFISRAAVIESRMAGFENRTLLIALKRPMAIVSTLRGPLSDVSSVGLHYLSQPGWTVFHDAGLETLQVRTCSLLGTDTRGCHVLFTGADIDNASVQKREHEKLVVYAIVTAGAEGNALRAGSDPGSFDELGTINVLLAANVRLTQRAMSRAIIVATEAKTAALQDLDVRSSVSPLRNQATGTGTDNVVVLSGEGKRVDLTGGHTKVGQLMAEAVYAGVKEAVGAQNHFYPRRNIFRRLRERGIELYPLVVDVLQRRGSGDPPTRFLAALEELLLRPDLAGFVEAAMAISDAHRHGGISDLRAFDAWCQNIANTVAKQHGVQRRRYVDLAGLPVPLARAIDALLSGLVHGSESSADSSPRG